MDRSANNLTGWLESIPTFLEQLERHRHTDDLVLANRLCGRCDDYLSLLHALLARAEEEMLTSVDDEHVHELMSDIHAIAVSLTTLAEHYYDWVLQRSTGWCIFYPGQSLLNPYYFCAHKLACFARSFRKIDILRVTTF